LAQFFISKQIKLKHAFRQFDKNGSGGIDYEEFGVGLRKLGLPFTDKECLLLARFVDVNESGNISKKEFKKAFKVVDGSNSKMGSNILKEVLQSVYENKYEYRRLFQDIDINETEYVTVPEFKTVLRAINELLENPLSDMQIDMLPDLLAYDEKINYENFLDGVSIIDTST